MEFLLNM